MRRRQGELVYLEQAILDVAKWFQDGRGDFYASQGSFLARLGLKMADHNGSCVPMDLVRKGTLYRALSRLERMGYLESRWEQLPPGENRPRRRYYKLTEDKPKKEGK